MRQDQLAIFYGDEEGIFLFWIPRRVYQAVALLWARSMFQPFPSLAGAEWSITSCYIISL